jgi:hypothetical protein
VPRPGHDPHRIRRDVRRCRIGGCRAQRRPARLGLPRLQGPLPQRLGRRHDRRLRVVPRPPENRPTRLLPVALAGPISPGRDLRCLQQAPARRQNRVLGLNDETTKAACGTTFFLAFRPFSH